MAPNLALSTHDLIQNMISCKLHGDIVPTDDDVAKIVLHTYNTPPSIKLPALRVNKSPLERYRATHVHYTYHDIRIT
jgi:hypothetical protein